MSLRTLQANVKTATLTPDRVAPLPDGLAAKREEYVNDLDFLGIMSVWFRVTFTDLYESETSLYVKEAEE